MAPPPRRPPELPEELVEEVLLRIPPADPARLARAALVSKRWCRLVTVRGFRRRFRERHRRATPLLGFLFNRADTAHFVPTSSFRPPRAADRCRGLLTLHSEHGRVLLLLHHADWGLNDLLVVWDPITGEHQELPMEPVYPYTSLKSWNRCDRDHLDCHRGPFLVVFMGTTGVDTFSRVYSSEAGSWSKPRYAPEPYDGFELGNSILLANLLYFKIDEEIIEYNLVNQEVSLVAMPWRTQQRCVLMASVDGGLGFAVVRGDKLQLWELEAGPDTWSLERNIDLGALLPIDALSVKTQAAGYADHEGDGVIFIWTSVGFFTIDLWSDRVEKVGDCRGLYKAVPYVSFCTPALAAVPTDEEPGAGASSA
ncbi:unnamed protein product [Urochloa decumbens]|uniref:F-box domain-containing protein n=1 Tax=Urochloa decumbens TaxID=240449 RepID=A0ABC9GBC6_9POAL